MMKYFWIGSAILALLLTLGVTSNIASGLILRKSEALLRQADEAVGRNELQKALEKSRQAEEEWSKGKKMLHITMTHTLLDEVDASFSNLDTYGEEEEQTEYRVCCRELLLKLQHIRDMDIPHYYHFL